MSSKNYQLIDSITLLSDNNSFSITIWDAIDNLWFLRHLKELKIKTKTIFYKQSETIRTRKSTVYPRKELRKIFNNTVELLDYLNTKDYDIDYFEIVFENNLRINIRANNFVTFYNNSKMDRNNLINKLMLISGYYNFPIEKLAINIEYNFVKDNCLSDFGIGLKPDEFWSEEQWENCLSERRKLNKNGLIRVNLKAPTIKID